MKKVLLFIFVTLFLPSFLQAQSDSCGFNTINDPSQSVLNTFDYRLHKWKQNTNNLNLPPTEFPCNGCIIFNSNGCTKANYIIPVVVHVVYDANDAYGQGTNISLEQIENQLEALNRAYSNYGNSFDKSVNTGIQFCLVDTTRIASGHTNHRAKDKDSLMDAINPYNNFSGKSDEKYLNIYVVNQILSDDGIPTGIRGYGTYPSVAGRQGVVMQASRFGRFDNACSTCVLDTITEGKVLVHEVGHYLGLYHTFRGACAGTTTSTCSLEGDGCCDTPPEEFSRECKDTNTCIEINDTADMIQNYMNWRPDACRTTFTYNQTERMYYTLQKIRTGLVDVNHINTLNLNCCVFSANFYIDKGLVCSPDTFHFETFEYADTSTRYIWSFYDGDTLRKTNVTNSHLWSYFMQDTAIWDVELRVALNGDTVTHKKQNYMELRNCGGHFPSTQGHWYFGEYAGVQFRENGVIPDRRPSIDPKTVNTFEGGLSISDNSGNLLFYGSGFGSSPPYLLYGKNHDTIRVNTSGFDKPIAILNGNGHDAQTAVAMPVPNDTSKYYIITSNTSDVLGERSIYYSLLDVNLGANGLIDTSIYNVPLPYEPSLPYVEIYDSSTMVYDTFVQFTQELNAVPKCNGKDYWLLTKNSKRINDTASIMVYAVNSSGVTFHGSHKIKYNDLSASGGELKVSPDGLFVSIGNTILQFDKCAGTFTNYLDFGFDHSFYGATFSSNSKAFYYNTFEETASSVFEQLLFQIDLTLKDPIANRRLLGTGFLGASMQLGPDNKIYISNYEQDYLSIIHKPNAILSPSDPNACEYELEGLSLKVNGKGGKCQLGLPNMIDAKLDFVLEKEIYNRRWACDSIEFLTNACCDTIVLWDFGDGNTSTDKRPIHSYTSNGTYAVNLITKKDTLYDTVIVQNNIPLQIIGDTSSCDSNELFVYQVTPQNPDFVYNWTIYNGAGYIPDEGQVAYVRWPQPGYLSLEVTNFRTGCTANDTLFVNYAGDAIFNNTISGVEDFCNPLDSSQTLILGSSPSSGSGSYQYKWFKSSDQINWQEISGATGKEYYHQEDKSAFLRRTVISGCESNSNVIEKKFKGFTNTIKVVKYPCSIDSFLEVNSEFSPYISPFSLSFHWEYSYDSLSWTTLPNDSNKKNLEIALIQDSIFIRSKIKSTAQNQCQIWYYSNTIKIFRPKISISTQPLDVTTCAGNCVPLSIGLKNDSNLNLEYNYLIFDTCGLPLVQTNDSLFVYLNNNGGTYTRVRINNLCGDTLYTNSSTTTYDSYGSDFDLQPTDQFGYSPTPVFKAIPNSIAKNIGWQESMDRGVTWNTIFNEEDTLLSYTLTSACEDIILIRAFAFNTCDTVYSDSARLFPIGYDLWMKDLWSDIGEEPFEGAKNSYTHSPDIWIRYSQLDQSKHSNPWGPQSVNYQFPRHDTTNWINVTIRNNGPDSSELARLYLHWTRASGAEPWSKAWINDPNDQYHNQITNTYYPKGGRINHSPIYIDPLGPGDTININYLWDTADVPKPGWYHHQVGNFFVHNDHIGVCFLARIETCNDSAFGMTYPEGTRLQPNVYKNNNIVSHNTVQSHLYAPGTIRKPAAIWLPIINDWDTLLLTDIGLDFNDADFFNYAEILVFLDDSLEAKWTQAGQMGTGFTIISSNTLLIDNPATFTLTGLDIQPNEEVNIGYYFREKLGGLAPTGMTKLYWFEAWQHAQGKESRDGSVSIFLDAPTTSADGSGGDGGEGDGPVAPERKIKEKEVEIQEESDAKVSPILQEKSDKTKVEEKPILESKFTAYPNPFENNLTVEYTLLLDTEIEVCLTDVLGRCIIDIVPLQKQEKGAYKESVNTQEITAGMYYIELKSNGKVFAKKLVRIN